MTETFLSSSIDWGDWPGEFYQKSGFWLPLVTLSYVPIWYNFEHIILKINKTVDATKSETQRMGPF